MNGAVPPLPCTFSWRDTWFGNGTTLAFLHLYLEPRNCHICSCMLSFSETPNLFSKLWRTRTLAIQPVSIYFSDQAKSCKINCLIEPGWEIALQETRPWWVHSDRDRKSIWAEWKYLTPERSVTRSVRMLFSWHKVTLIVCMEILVTWPHWLFVSCFLSSLLSSCLLSYFLPLLSVLLFLLLSFFLCSHLHSLITAYVLVEKAT